MGTVENIDVNKYKLTFSVDAERFEEGLQHSYNKNKGYFNVPGFRKGKAPRKIVEKQYGGEVLYDDAINFVLQDAYVAAAKDSGLDIVSKPSIEVTEANPETGVVFNAVVYVKPEVSISDYKGIEVKHYDAAVTEEDIENRINADRNSNSRKITVTDRPVQDGDNVTIDFEGFIDGVAFEGGKGKDYQLKIGSHSFIDNFEEQLIGSNVGDDAEVNVTFPEDYHQKDYAGKQAMFKVEIKDIEQEQVPELDDAFVQDTTEFESVDEYKNFIKEQLEESKKEEAKNSKQEEIIEKLIEKAEMNLPEAMVENEIDHKIHDFEHNLRHQGLDLQTYLQYMNQSMENMREAYRIISEKQVKGRLILEKIADLEGFEVSEEEVNSEIDRLMEAYHVDVKLRDQIFVDEEKKNVINDLKVQKAINFVVENAVETASEE